MAKKATFRRAAGGSLESGGGSLESGVQSPEVVGEVDGVDGGGQEPEEVVGGSLESGVQSPEVVGEVDGVDGGGQEPEEVDPREIDLSAVADVESLRAIASALQEHCAELGAHMVGAIEERDALRAAAEAVVVLEGEVGASALMGLGAFEEVPVEVRRALPRADLAGYEVGDVVAVVRLAPGWSLHSLVDHVRDGFCNARK